MVSTVYIPSLTLSFFYSAEYLHYIFYVCIFAVFSVGMPSIRPLETLHNSMSLRHLDTFLDETILKRPGPPESEESGSRVRANLRKLSPY